MTSLVSNVMITHLPAPLLAYGSSFEKVEFRYADSEAEIISPSWTLDILCAPQMITAFRVATSIELFATSETRASSHAVPSPEVTAEIAELRTVVNAIRNSRALPAVSLEFDELLTHAVQARGIPHDVQGWARHLAEDAGDIED